MRLDPKLVHPSIFKATDGIVFSGKMYDGSPASIRVMNAHQKVWFQEYGKGCLLYSAGAVATFVASTAFAHDMAKPWKALFLLGVMAAVFAIGALAYWRNLRQLTAPELAALMPMLDLTEGQRAYAETVVALDRSGRPMAEIEETMVALNALLDEEARLVEARERLAGADLAAGREGLQKERERIAAKAAGARDPEARAAFEQSLALLDERIAALDAQGGGLERIDAHLELLRQALLATRDAALHRGAAPTILPDLGADALRSAVSRARAQTQATEQALAELNAI